ncbi:MAG: DUF721 domain-containing protein [Muribaculaceae bacterium]|nr:DUF721 domain-containing protein [Muribaculaceae bacterium]
MKRYDPQSLGDVMRETIERAGMADLLYEARAVNAWPAVVGPEIAARTARPHVHRGLMTIAVRNASLRQELNMCRSQLRRHLNESVGRDVIKEVRFK